MTWKRWLLLINDIFDSKRNATRWGNRFNTLIVVLILLNVLAISLESVDHFEENHLIWFEIFEVFSVVIFSIEYGFNIFTAHLKSAYRKKNPVIARLLFMVSWGGIIDLLAILPFYLPILGGIDLRFIRIFRTLKLLRITHMGKLGKSLSLMGYVFKEKKEDLFVTSIICTILIVFSAVCIYFLEHEAQPHLFPDIPNSLWWAVTTLTAVGYGDVYPITPLGKVFSGIMSFIGIGFVALPTGIIGSAYFELIRGKKQTKNGANFCPHCGKQIS